MKRVEVTYSTMGQSSPASAAEGGWYRWNGDPDKSEAARQDGRDRRASRAGGSARGAASIRDRSVRFRRYCALRDGGMSKEDARRDPGVNVAADTVRKYERARRAELEARDA